MRVLQINSVCGIRSTGRICTDIADILANDGYSCKIAYGRENTLKKFSDIAVRTDTYSGVRIHALQSRIFDNSGFARYGATEKFLKNISEFEPDIIHLHNIHGYYINVEALFRELKKLGKPVVWTLHDCWAFTGHCTYFSLADCEKWRSGCENCPQKRSYPKSLVFDRSRENYLRKKELFCGVEDMVLVTPSQWLADLAAQSFLKEYPVKVIHNGIDIDDFKPIKSDFRQRFGVGNKKMVLAVASVWGRGKGLYDVIRLPELLGKDYVVVMVGLNDEQKKELPPEIIGITKTNSVRELAEIYSAADVFVNFTYADNYPTVNLEAQCCGTPVITYRTGGSIESVPEGQIVSCGDIAAAADESRDICENGNYVIMNREMFDKRRAGREYIELYKAMLGSKKRKI